MYFICPKDLKNFVTLIYLFPLRMNRKITLRHSTEQYFTMKFDYIYA